MNARIFAATLLCSALSATPLAAQTAEPSTPVTSPAVPPSVEQRADPPEIKAKKEEVVKQLLKLMRPVWTDEQIGRIMLIGWYSGAAAMCDDIELDSGKLGRAIAAVIPPEGEKITAAKRRFLSDNLMMNVGMATGLVMGTHYRDVPQFCGDARQAMQDLPADKHLFQVMSGAKAP
jgi:glucose/arabinose dehydrogenase